MTVQELKEKLKKKQGFLNPKLIKNSRICLCRNEDYFLEWTPREVIRFRVYKKCKDFYQEVSHSLIFSQNIKKYFSSSEILYAQNEIKNYRKRVGKYIKDLSNV